MAYSPDFRHNVLAFVNAGESAAAVAERFGIGERTVRRLQQWRFIFTIARRFIEPWPFCFWMNPAPRRT